MSNWPNLTRKQVLRFRSRAVDMDFAVAMGEGSPVITGGYGGWTTVERPDDIAFTEWVSGEPIKMAVPIAFNGMRYQESQEEEIREILKLGRKGGDPPPVFMMTGSIPHKRLRWVLESIEFGEPLRGKRHGKIIYQAMTLNVMEYIDPDTIRLRKKKKHRGSRKGQRQRGSIHHAKQGDTMVKMAVRFYSDRTKWRLIQKANPKLPKDPRKVIPKGTKVKIPAN